MTSFPRFEEAFGFFVKEEKISLFEVFKEICGEKRKYITFRRMLKTYLIYKNFPQNLTLDTKKFFDFVLRTLMKKSGNKIGDIKEGAKKFSTVNCKYKKAISKIYVLTNDKKDIKGSFLLYCKALIL